MSGSDNTSLRNPNSMGRELQRNAIPYLMAVPGLLLIIAFAYLPFGYILSAFQRFNLQDGILGSEWVGLRNFAFFFKLGGKALQITWNTIWLNTLLIGAGLVFQVGLALMVNEIRSTWFKKVTQTIYFFPYFLSWVVIGEIIYNLLSSDYGAINGMLAQLGLAPVAWYKHPEYWRGILVMASLWKGAGYGSLVYLATLSG